MTLQYIKPVTSGDSSPAATATMASSSSARPASTWPCSSRIRPCWWRAQAIRSASPTALADIRGSRRACVGGLALPGGELLFHEGGEQVALLGTLAAFALQQPLGTGEPAGRAAHLAAKEQAKPEPECTADSAAAFAKSRWA